MSMASSASRRTHRVRVLTLRTGAAAALASVLLLAGALPAGASPSMQTTGSSFASIAFQQWVGQSSTLFGLNINWQVSSSVIGLNNFGQSQVDFAASDIPYSAQQSTYYPSQPYQYLPDVAGGLAFMFNVNGNDGQRITNLNLTPSLVGQIFLGEITKWNDGAIAAANPSIAPNLPSTNIIPVFRSDASGENYLLTDYLLSQDGGDIVAAQNAFQSGNPGQPSASWPVPSSSAKYDTNRYKGWSAGYPVGESGSDGAANYVAALSSLGSITYVETAFAKNHGFPVANLHNASGAFVQPTSVNVSVALEAALLHADLTQDLSKVYVNPLPQSYPLSAYSYIVAPCSPSLAAAQHSVCAANPAGVPGSNPTGPTSPFAPQKGQALGQFASFLACAGQSKMAQLGYSPLPPVLVQEDFNAVGGFHEEYWPGEDTVLCLKLTKDREKEILYVPNVLVYHHRRAVYRPHLRQVYAYAVHRGFFVKKFPETSRQLQYFVPSLFVTGIALGLALSFFNRPFMWAYIGVVAFYLLLTLLSSVKTLFVLINALIFPGIVATHFTYGIGFIKGLLSRKMKEQ